MKQQYKFAALAAAMMVAWGTASAQSPTRTESTGEFAQSLSYREYLKGEDLRASKLVGARVRNATGDNLGEIEELVIASRARDDMLVIVSVGGVLDIGDKLVALPYADLRVSPDGDTFYIDRTEAQLKAAPAYTFDTQAEVQARSDRPVVREERVVERDRDERLVERDRDVDRDRDERIVDRDRDERIVDRDRDERIVDRDRDERIVDRDRDERVVDRDAPRARTAEPVVERPRTTAPAVAVAAKSENVVLDVFDYRASDLIGATVLDDRGEAVGKVDDIVVSTEDDKLHAVVAIGGFAGFGAKLISMPFDALQITSDDDNPRVRIAMTGEQLQQLVESRAEFRYERQLAQTPAATPRG